MRYLANGFILILLQFLCVSSYAQNDEAVADLSGVLLKMYENSPTLKAAREELAETKELYPQARAGWLPNLGAETSLYATDIESSNFSAGTGATTKDMTVNIDQPIWRGGRTFAETARARELIKAGEAILAQVEQDMFLQTATVYANLIRDTQILNLRRENEQILHKDWQAASERWKGGELTVTDVEQANTRYLTAQAASVQAASNLDIAEAEFEEITGIAAPARIRMPHMHFNFPETVDDMTVLAEQQNPQLHIIQFQQQAAEHDVDARFRELLPQVFAFASYNRQYDPQPGIVPESETQTVGMRATLALYQGGATRSRIRAARYAAKRQEYEIQETAQRIRQEVTSNWRAYQTAKTQTRLRQAQIATAERALAGFREEERMGQRSLLDVFEADEDLIEAKTEHVNAVRNETIAKFSLANSLGLLTFETLALGRSDQK